jgi:uncharacterized protein involved in exopolysaccharide biosynthesis
MPGVRSPAQSPQDGELRLELTSAEVRQVCALYSRPGPTALPRTRQTRAATETPLAAFVRELRPLAWKGRRTLALSTAAALALGLIFLWAVTPTFAVRALVLVEQRGPSVREGAVPRDPSAFLAGQAEILGGASLVREALIRSQLGLSAEPSGWTDRLSGWLSRSPAPPERSEREALAQVLRAFSAAPVFGTELIALELRTRDPAAGVRFVQAVIDGYEEFASSLQSGDRGVAVRTLTAPTRLGSPLWPRPAPVLISCVILGLLAGLGLAALAERAREPDAGWAEIRDVAWAA